MDMIIIFWQNNEPEPLVVSASMSRGGLLVTEWTISDTVGGNKDMIFFKTLAMACTLLQSELDSYIVADFFIIECFDFVDTRISVSIELMHVFFQVTELLC